MNLLNQCFAISDDHIITLQSIFLYIILYVMEIAKRLVLQIHRAPNLIREIGGDLARIRSLQQSAVEIQYR